MQPSGTVTLVFTDIEGSTQLLADLGVAGYQRALAEHRERIRPAFARFDGYEVDYEGDSFFYAFASASAAVSAVREAMAALGCGPIRVRVGIHTGEPELDPPKYVGMDVHRAARIMSCAHGGQVVLSQATRELLEKPDGLSDLGEHRLKDLSGRIRLYQLGEGEFPPLRSLHRTNLPVPATAFLGRLRELAEVVSLLDRDDVRLLTLTGPGGTGKTRLALQVAAETSERFPDGVWWVPLESITDPTRVLSTVAQVLELMEEPGRELVDTLADRLTGKRLLLLLDNAEHLLPEAAASIAALRESPGPLVLVTSRQRLHLPGEQLYPVPSLTDEDAAALFTARARQLDPAFAGTAAIATLCARLDNLPLAIELAAARTSLFEPQQLLERLGQRLDLLRGTGDTDPRHETLRTTIDWSYELLDQEERRVYRTLSIFAAGCTLEAAEQICNAHPDILESLLDKSLLRRRNTQFGPRYWMLESLREYGLERLNQLGEVDELRDRHERWFATLAEQADSEQSALLRDSWLGRLSLEENNLRAAIDWAISREDGVALARLAASLGLTWVWRGELKEARGWLDLACAGVAAYEAPLHARVLMVAGFVRVMQGDHGPARALLEEALAICRDHGDVEGTGFCLNSLGIAAMVREDVKEARALWEECRELGRVHALEGRLAIAALNLSSLALRERRLDDARVLAEEASHALAEAGSPLWCNALFVLGEIARLSGRNADSERILRQCLLACVERRGRTIGASVLMHLAILAAARGEADRAARLLGAGEGLLETTGAGGQTEDEGQAARTELHQQLSDSELGALLAEGRAMPFDEAARYALEINPRSTSKEPTTSPIR